MWETNSLNSYGIKLDGKDEALNTSVFHWPWSSPQLLQSLQPTMLTPDTAAYFFPLFYHPTYPSQLNHVMYNHINQKPLPWWIVKDVTVTPPINSADATGRNCLFSPNKQSIISFFCLLDCGLDCFICNFYVCVYIWNQFQFFIEVQK